MIRLEEGMRTSDVSQWLNRGWFLASDGPNLSPAQMAYFPDEDSDDEMMWPVETITGFRREYDFEALPDNVFPHWPECGSINIKERMVAVHLERLQMKQWRRTYNSRQIRLRVPRLWEFQSKDKRIGQLTPDNVDVVRSAFDPEYPDYGKWAGVKAMFNEGWHSVALSPQVIITNTEPRLVYYGGLLAAKALGAVFDPIDVRATAMLNKLYPGGLNL